MLKPFMLLFLTVGVHCGRVQYRDCGHNEIQYLSFSSCGGPVCRIHRGRPLQLTFPFIANQDTSTATIQMVAHIGGQQMPVPGLKVDGCSHVKCPLVKGQLVQFSYNFIVPTMLPKTRATATAKLIGDHGVLCCFQMDFDVVDGESLDGINGEENN